jgi:hypothetical protein
MHIIFDPVAKAELEQKHIVLELDTMVLPNQNNPVTAYCVLEYVPFQELAVVDKLQSWHRELMEAYRAQDWDGCLSGITRLKGQWGGKVDSFYDILHERIRGFKDQAPDPEWDGILRKNN